MLPMWAVCLLRPVRQWAGGFRSLGCTAPLELPVLCGLGAGVLLYVGQEHQGFPESSVGKESTCNARDPSSIPGSGRYSGEEIGYPLQYWASLVAQLEKNPPAMQETWV